MPTFNKKLLAKLNYWISEREAIRKRKAAGEPKPWTKDALLRDNRWCNVRRMDDKVSIWLREVWYAQRMCETVPGVLAAATLARLVNWPASLEHLLNMHQWDKKTAIKHLTIHKLKGNKVFTGAYIINGASGGDKIKTVCTQVQTVYDNAAFFTNFDTMHATWERLMRTRGIGSFIAGQIVADLRWAASGNWSDRFDWAPVGPGSARGMRRLLDLPAVGPLAQKQFYDLLPALWEQMMSFEETSNIFDDRSCEAMDLQNCLCEFDKYMRLTNGEGSVKNKYNGQPETGKLI